MDRQDFEDYSVDDTEYFGARKVVEDELKYIRKRRGLDDDAPVEHLTGLALSGGGIRSASFAMGVLQAMAYKGWLKNVVFLSTVSGCGYIVLIVFFFIWNREKGSLSARLRLVGSAPYISSFRV